MLIFMTNLGGVGPFMGGWNWRVGPLFLLLPMLLSSGLLSLPLHLLSALLGISGPRLRRAFDPTTHTWVVVESSGSAVEWVLGLVVATGLVALGIATIRVSRRQGMLRSLCRLLFQGLAGGGGGGVGQQQQQPQDGDGNRRVTRSHSERLAAAAEALNQLPLETFFTVDDLMRKPAAELRALAKQRGVDCGRVAEKAALAAAIAAGANSSGDACSVCCEDYASGDVLRVLRCGHRYHLECIDRW